MKRVLFVLNRIGGGGAERVATLIANELANKGIEIKVLTFCDLNQTYNINVNVECESINIKNKNRFIKKIKRVLCLRKKIKKYKPDVVIAFEYFINMQTILASFGTKCRVIISERNDPRNVGNSFIMKKLRNVLYSLTDVLVCQTNDAKMYFPKNIQKKSIIIPNPISPNLPRRFEGERKKSIVTFCRLEKQKNLNMLIDAFEILNKEYSEYNLLIYGDGILKEELISYIDKKNLNNVIEIRGFQREIHKLVVDASMFVSTSNYEGISNSMLEALGMGLPVVATDCPCGGAKMMIENNVNGILIPVGDITACYNAMKKILDDKMFSNMLSENAIKINDRLEQSKICKMWIDIINTKEK